MDNGANWIAPDEGIAKAASKGTASAAVNLPLDKPIMIRINQTSGSDKVSCYLDDIKLYYKDTWPVVITGDVNNDGEVNIADANTVIGLILDSSMSSEDLPNADVNGDGEISIADINMIIDIILGS